MADTLKRPMPPLDPDETYHLYNRVYPANDVLEWVSDQILSEDGQLYNPDHFHLIEADICIMWADTAFTKQGRAVLGQAEQVAMRAGGWQKARMEQQMYEWFGRVPKFIITLAADFCSQCTDVEFCALIEHELYHIAQATDEFGAPKFNKEGQPVLTMRGHDVEEFVGVVRRYGASTEVQELIDAANTPAEVAHLNIARACGTCMLKLA